MIFALCHFTRRHQGQFTFRGLVLFHVAAVCLYTFSFEDMTCGVGVVCGSVFGD